MNNDRVTDDPFLDRTDRRDDPSCWEAASSQGIVCTAHYRATWAGVEMLRRGGNAIDAAAAASLALAVVEPAASGLGGMAMMTVHLARPGRTFTLEGPCRAPLEATPEAVRQRNRGRGYEAVAVPTYAAAIDHALQRYGTMSLAAVSAPAIALAEDGYRITPTQRRLLKRYLEAILEGNAASLLLDGHGSPPSVGTVVRNPALADALRRFAAGGASEFYHGHIGRVILGDMAAGGGFITATDFAGIPWPQETEPLHGPFGPWAVYTTAPPGGGFALLEMLSLFDALRHDGFDADAPEGAALLAAIIQQARVDRRRLRLRLTREWALGNPEQLSTAYAERIAGQIHSRPRGPGETTHLNVIDREGNVVALTQSIERSFGAKVACRELGFLYNGFMKGLKVKNERHPHYLRPGAVARSNASPTILIGPQRAILAIGSTGSERIASGIFQVLVRLERQNPFEAVQAPRLHCTPEGWVTCEAERFDPAVLEHLAARGFRVTSYQEPWAFSAGGLHLAGRTDGTPWGVAEPRRDGLAAGPNDTSS